jgi:3-hydroxyisobutyrate dehydrogenase
MEAMGNDAKPVVGLIGLGNLGKPMALSLLASGYRMVVNSLQRSEADDLVQRGAEWATVLRRLRPKSTFSSRSCPVPRKFERS